jgi:D-tyrosyl-tRNA(Tyr) deacylase
MSTETTKFPPWELYDPIEIDKMRAIVNAAADFAENVKRHNIAGMGEVHVATDASFRVLRDALDKGHVNPDLRERTPFVHHHV